MGHSRLATPYDILKESIAQASSISASTYKLHMRELHNEYLEGIILSNVL